MVYHSKISKERGWQRNVRIEKFDWNADGSPRFPIPTTEGTVLKKPSGEKPPVKGTSFTDSFDDGLWDSWQYFGYNRFIDVRNGQLHLGIDPGWGTANNYRCGEKAMVRNAVWDNFTFSAKTKIVKGERDAGLVFRVQHPAVGYDAMKGYFAGIMPGADRAILGKMNGRKWIEIKRADLSVEAGKEYTLEVCVRDGMIQFFVDGKLVIDAVDDEYTSGYCGLRIVSGEAAFDDVLIRADQR